MNKKAVLGLLLAVIIPVTCFLFLRSKSDEVVALPNRMIYDTVISTIREGKQVNDTVWHKLSPFSFKNQEGETVTLDKYEGKVKIIDFFFTHCPSICPTMTKNMKRLQESLTSPARVGDKTNHYINFLSFSIDPERDSVPQLKQWADKFQINPEQWDLITGDKKAIYNLAINDVKLATVDGDKVDENFIHSDKFILIDRFNNIRGYYSGLDSADLAQLSRDAVLLTLERDRTKKSALSSNLDILAVAFLIVAVLVGLFFIMFKKKQNVESLLDKK